MRTSLQNLSLRLFRVLLQLYPKRFRDAFAEEMTQTFRALLNAESSRGTSAFLRLWQRTVWDMASSAIKERGEEMKGRGCSLLGAAVLSLAIAWIDSRPHWDDTGISAGVIFLACALLGKAC